jgi:hypothetical protein
MFNRINDFRSILLYSLKHGIYVFRIRVIRLFKFIYIRNALMMLKFMISYFKIANV